ncbi:MAG TPA: transglycosylase SLT domain-containing protein, partial [Candidatus Baltobacteraceae bacterium]
MSFVAAIVRSLLALLLCVSVCAPANAQPRLTGGLLGFYSGFVRSINPHLALWQCDVYAHALLDNAHRLHLDPALLAAIVTVESHWDPSARSWRGAEGLGQLMPTTAQELGVDPSSGR